MARVAVQLVRAATADARQKTMMQRYCWMLVLLTCPVLLLGRVGSVGARPERAARRDGVQIDSIGLQLVGSWPFGPSQAIACDAQRQVVFSSAGGVVQFFDLSNPVQPKQVGADIYAAGAVVQLEYDSDAQRLYVASANGAIEVWSVQDLQAPRQFGFIVLPGAATGLYRQGALLYCAVPDLSMFVILSVADPCHPLEVSCLEDMDDDPLMVLVAGDIAYVGCDGALDVFDVSQPATPRLLSYYDEEAGTVMGMALYGWLLYLAHDYGITVVDVSNPRQPETVSYTGEWDLGAVQAMEMSGWLAYVADDEGNLVVVDVSNPVLPRVAAQLATGSDLAWDVTLLGNSACVAAGEQGMVVVDITHPTGPGILTQIGDENSPSDAVVAQDGWAYVARYESLLVYDMTDPAYPRFAGACTLDLDQPDDMIVRGGYVYASSGASLLIVDVGDPANPHLVGTLDDLGGEQIDVAGDYLYSAYGDGWLDVIDIRDRARPSKYGYVPLGGAALDVAVVGQLCCVATEGAGLVVLDVSDPSNPQVVGHGPADELAWVTACGHYAYCISWDTPLVVYDLTDPTQPRELGRYENYDVEPIRPVIDGSNVYLAGEDMGLYIVDVTDPAQPQEIAHILTDDEEVFWTAVDRRVAYVATDMRGIVVLDVTDPAAMHQVGSVPGWGSPNAVAAAGGHVFLADDSRGLLVLATDSLPRLRQYGRLDSLGVVRCVALDGNTAWLVAGKHLTAADITNPADPRELGSVSLPYTGRGLALAGNLAFVADNTKGLVIVDVADPSNPQVVSTVPEPKHAYGVAVRDNYAYVANRNTSSARWPLYVVDVSDPSTPQIVDSSSCGHLKYAYDVVLRDTLAYLACGRYGCRVVSIADPTHPQPVDSFGAGDWRKLFVSGQYLYAAGDEHGVQVYDLSRPAKPCLVAQYDTPGSALGVFADDRYVYVADGPGGAEMLRNLLTFPREYGVTSTQVRVVRNPVSPAGLVVAVDLRQAADVTFDLFNVAGQLVGSRHERWLAPGSHQFKLSVAGLAAGAYFLRTAGAGELPPLKFVLTR